MTKEKALEQPEIGDAEIKQMLNDIEYYQKRVKELEQLLQDYVLICKRCGDDIGLEYVPDEQLAFDYNIAFSHGYEAHRVEQAAQEPIYIIGEGWKCDKFPPEGTKLYTHSHQWQELTNAEIEYWECLKAPPVHPDFIHDDSWMEFARCIEQALKKKNT